MRSSSGNAILELVLFVPIGILFALGILDAGLFLLDRARAEAVLRAGLSEHLPFLASEGPLHRTELNINRAFLPEMLRGIHAHLRRLLAVSDPVGSYTVSVAVIGVPVETDTGESRGAWQLIADRSEAELRYAELIDRELAPLLTGSPSPLALPLAEIPSLANSGPSHVRFAPWILVLYGEIRSAPRSVAPGVLENLLGLSFEVEVRAAQTFRAILR